MYDTLDDIPYSHENRKKLGWFYHDPPHGGFAALDVLMVGVRDVDVPVVVAIEFTDLEAAVPDESGYLVEAKIVPTPATLCDEARENVDGCVGRESIDVYDVAMYGYSVGIGEAWGAETWEDGFQELRGDLAFGSTLPGFVLDRAWNRLGTTGWDLLEECVFGEDAFEKSLERVRKAHDSLGA